MSDRANPAADILPRSIWRTGTDRVRVLSTAGGYVHYSPGPELPMHHLQFRRSFELLYAEGMAIDLDPTETWRYDRRAVKSQFSMSLANLPEFRAFWLPGRRKLVARSVCCTRRFALPPDALLVGTYARPFTADAFLEDLDCVLASITQQAECA